MAESGCDRHASATVLSITERDRASQFLDDVARDLFVLARSTLRDLASELMGCPAAEVPLEQAASGQLTVADQPWHVSLAHSGTRVVVAISSRPVGVDLEPKPTTAVNPGLMRSTCTREELRWLKHRRGARRDLAWTRLWVRKEAAAKALGLGLHLPFAHHDARRRRIAGTRVSKLVSPAGYVAAIAIADSAS